MNARIIPHLAPTDHWPELAEKRGLTDGRRIYGVICGPCSAQSEDYIKCRWLDEYPDVVTQFDEILK